MRSLGKTNASPGTGRPSHPSRPLTVEKPGAGKRQKTSRAPRSKREKTVLFVTFGRR